MVHILRFLLNIIACILFGGTGGIMLYVLGLVFWDVYYFEIAGKIIEHIWE